MNGTNKRIIESSPSCWLDLQKKTQSPILTFTACADKFKELTLTISSDFFASVSKNRFKTSLFTNCSNLMNHFINFFNVCYDTFQPISVRHVIQTRV